MTGGNKDVPVRVRVLLACLAWAAMGVGSACAQEAALESLEVRPLPPVNESAINQPESVEVIPPGAPERGAAERLGLNDLEAMALAGNPALAQAAAKVEATRGAWV